MGSEDSTNSTNGNSSETKSSVPSFAGGVRLVRVFESFAKPELFKVKDMPSSINLDLKTNVADEDEGNVVPSTAQSNAAPTWMSTPTGGETISRPEALPSVPSTTENVENEDDDELVIEDVTNEAATLSDIGVVC
tara:strand:- start:129 stop:533 length:405 start_codon:yes stop_codon:yes gene_type:complete